MTHRHRLGRFLPGAVLALAAFLTALPASPSGFQVMTQGARASGMGLAFTAVADDPTAIFYNPAGLGFMTHYEGSLGGSILFRTTRDFEGTNPYPGAVSEHYQNQTFFLPNAYGVVPIIENLTFGIGSFAPYGLGVRWENAEVFTGAPGTSPVNGPASFSGRFISQNVVVQSLDVNGVIAYRIIPELSIAAGADYRFSKVQLERNQAAINPFTTSVVDVAHIKLNGDLLDNHGWGWNVALLAKPIDMLSIGASYRSSITIDFDESATFKQRNTGNAALDALVATQLPSPGAHQALTKIKFPASLDTGVAVNLLQNALTIALEADWTQWSSFQTLDVVFPDLPAVGIHRADLWSDSWAYRVGVQYKFQSGWALRGGYYYDNTPQPAVDAGPILSDNDRNVFSAGFGYNTERWGIDVSDLYIKFKDRTTPFPNTDKYYGTFKETANVVSLNFRVAF